MEEREIETDIIKECEKRLIKLGYEKKPVGRLRKYEYSIGEGYGCVCIQYSNTTLTKKPDNIITIATGVFGNGFILVFQLCDDCKENKNTVDSLAILFCMNAIRKEV